MLERMTSLCKLITRDYRILASTVTAIVITVFFGGYYLALLNAESVHIDTLREELQEYKTVLEDIHLSNERQESLMLKKLATIHSQITRIEALGQYLSNRYDLSAEFNFMNQTGIGGTTDEGNKSDYEYINELQLNEVIQETERLIDETKIKLDLMLQELSRIESNKARKPQGWPVNYPVVSSRFGYRISPFTGKREIHRGIDISGKVGNHISAVASGIVKRAGNYGHYGNLVEIKHADGYRTLYAHNSHLLVRKNDMVKKGQRIALLGNTGRSTGPHLHFEVLKNGKRIDPQIFIARNK